MFEISNEPIRIFLDFNAVIVNLNNLPQEKQDTCISAIEEKVQELKGCLCENMGEKMQSEDIPKTAKAVLKQQYLLIQAIENWLSSIK